VTENADPGTPEGVDILHGLTETSPELDGLRHDWLPGQVPDYSSLTRRGQEAARSSALDMIRRETPASPPALVLPDGWKERRDHVDGDPYYRRTVPMTGHVDCDKGGVFPVPYPDRINNPADAQAFGRAIVEAAAIVKRLQAGAR